VTYFINFGTPSISRERLELDSSRLGQKVSGRGHVTYFRHFGTPSISRERLELVTSCLPCSFITRGTNEKKCKIRSKGSGRGHGT